MKRLLFALCFTLAGLEGIQAQDTYTLGRCLERGLERNYSIRISRNREKISSNNATAAHAGRLPQVDLSAGYSASLDSRETKSRADGSRERENDRLSQGLRAGLDVDWTLFDGFRISAEHNRLKELAEMGKTAARIVLEDFVAGMTAEYYNYVQQKIRLKNFRYAVNLSRERLRIVEERYHIGNFSRLDYQQAKVYFNADSALYMKQQEKVASSRIRLNELMAEEEVDLELSVTDTLILVDEGLEQDRLWQSALEVNAELLQAGHRTALARQDSRKVLSRNYPYVRLNAGYGYGLNRQEGGAFSRNSSWGPKGGLTVGMRLWDGNRSRERRNARLEIENAELEKEELELGLKAAFCNLWQAYRNNLRMLKLERQNLVAARENHVIAMERYMLGNLSGIEMREAQKSLLDAEERILSAEYETKVCEISLMQISGRVMDYLE